MIDGVTLKCSMSPYYIKAKQLVLHHKNGINAALKACFSKVKQVVLQTESNKNL